MATGGIKLDDTAARDGLMCSNSDVYTRTLLKKIFPEESHNYESKELTLENLEHVINSSLEGCQQEVTSVPEAVALSQGRYGILGPDVVAIDIAKNVGTVVIEQDRLGVTSHSNFSTLRANVCLFSGKWQYEVMLGSRGVNQLGWCTVNCKFSQENGVGDTLTSYAYDGGRVRKWNKYTEAYGELWETGDTIGCCIDCDEGSITFYRNGHSLGAAFSNVQTGSGIAYFPAVSISLNEVIRVNFGGTPLRYPVEGYQPLQEKPTADVKKADILLGYLNQLLPVIVDSEISQPEQQSKQIKSVDVEYSPRCAHYLTLSHILDKIAPLLKISYIVDSCLLKFMLNLYSSHDEDMKQKYLEAILDIMWSFMQDFELKPCLVNLFMSILSAYRFSPIDENYSLQKTYLGLTIGLLQHERTRKEALKHILFEKLKFPYFAYLKPPLMDSLEKMIPTPWWEVTTDNDSEDEVSSSQRLRREKNEEAKKLYMQACDVLHNTTVEVENMQIDIIQLLLNDTDGEQGASSRYIFLHKLRVYIKESTSQRHVIHLAQYVPPSVLLCFFHRLVQVFQNLWEVEKEMNEDIPYVPVNRFCDETFDFFEAQRLGGLMSHLRKQNKEEICAAITLVQSQDGKDDKSMPTDTMKPSRPKYTSLLELLDGVTILFQLAANKQLERMANLRDGADKYAILLEETEKKIELLETRPELYDEVSPELTRTKEVLLKKLVDVSRQVAWLRAVVFCKQKQEDVMWLLKSVMLTLKKSTTEQNYFLFVPEYYVDVCLHTNRAVKAYFHPTISYEDFKDYELVRQDFMEFLAVHFADSRIVNGETKELIVQTLACSICYKPWLLALEAAPRDSLMTMVHALLAPYESRAWAQTNWILARLWKGDGFAYRYKHLPHLMPARNQTQDIGAASLQEPCPSHLIQSLISDVLVQQNEVARKFLDTLLNQLNWAFSEFVGMLQELQQLANKKEEKVVIDSRQLKICATCFDITISLLRVLEMVAARAPQVFTDCDWSMSSAEVLIARLFQLLCHVLNRVTTKTSLFENIVNLTLPGMESVDHFPVLAAAVGIIITLVMKGSDQSRECAIAAILSEPGFNSELLQFLLGEGTQLLAAAAAVTPPSGSKKMKKPFALKNYDDVSSEEIHEVEELIRILKSKENNGRERAASVKEDDLCTICYAHPLAAVFKPCGHQSCRSCITYQLMQKNECFFCKKEIKMLEDLSGKPWDLELLPQTK